MTETSVALVSNKLASCSGLFFVFIIFSLLRKKVNVMLFYSNNNL